MKLAVILGDFSIGTRPLDFSDNNIWDSPRGLTGTEVTFSVISSELQKLGNEVHMFTVHSQSTKKPDMWNGCKLYNYIERHTVIDETFDAVISINEPDAFRGVNSKPLRICWQFLNDFTYCQPGFDDYVDVWLAVCDQHKNHLQRQVSKPEKWQTLPLGCDPSWYDADKKVPGRMIFCSSADRGLHLALQAFPKIKEQVPEAHLKIFYHFQAGSILDIDPNSKTDHPHVIELSHRLRYCREAMKRMQHMGVEHIGSVSVNEMKKQMSEASLLLFPVDTVAFSEGFSLSILQSHAAGAIPAISSADCLGSIYRDSGCLMTEMPVVAKLNEYVASAVKALTNKEFADSVRTKCKEFASKFLWSDIASNLCKVIAKNTTTMAPVVSTKQTTSLTTQQHKPKISVIDLTNRVGGMDILFESLKNQSFQDFELIIVDALYEYRKNIVAENAKAYNFTVKHIAPSNNTFPVSNYNNSMNTGICAAEGEVVYFTCDYAYLMQDTLLTHYNFHAQTPRNHILLLPVNDCLLRLDAVSNHFPKHRQYGHRNCPDDTKLLAVAEKIYVDAHNEWSDRYAEDISNGFLDQVMWSLFEKPFVYENGIQEFITTTSIDMKFNECSSTKSSSVFHDLCCVKNDSFKLDFLIEANGFDEDMDGAHGFFDTELARRLLRCHGAQFFAMNTMAASVINTRYYLEPRKILKGYNNIKIIDTKYNNEKPLLHGAVAEYRKQNAQV